MKKTLLCIAAAASAALAIVACGGNSAEVDEPELIVETDAPQVQMPSAQEIQKYQPDMRIAAVAQGNTIWVLATNATTRTLEVSPANFGVMANRKLHRPDPEGLVADFPLVELKPGRSAQGNLRFINVPIVPGRDYLVFYHPEVRPSRTRIHSGARPQPKPRKP